MKKADDALQKLYYFKFEKLATELINLEYKLLNKNFKSISNKLLAIRQIVGTKGPF